MTCIKDGMHNIKFDIYMHIMYIYIQITYSVHALIIDPFLQCELEVHWQRHQDSRHNSYHHISSSRNPARFAVDSIEEVGEFHKMSSNKRIKLETVLNCPIVSHS